MYNEDKYFEKFNSNEGRKNCFKNHVERNQEVFHILILKIPQSMQHILILDLG